MRGAGLYEYWFHSSEAARLVTPSQASAGQKPGQPTCWCRVIRKLNREAFLGSMSLSGNIKTKLRNTYLFRIVFLFDGQEWWPDAHGLRSAAVVRSPSNNQSLQRARRHQAGAVNHCWFGSFPGLIKPVNTWIFKTQVQVWSVSSMRVWHCS